MKICIPIYIYKKIHLHKPNVYSSGSVDKSEKSMYRSERYFNKNLAKIKILK